MLVALALLALLTVGALQRLRCRHGHDWTDVPAGHRCTRCGATDFTLDLPDEFHGSGWH